ncbi:MAG TPA: TIGR02281 family clan AA aspartic protease [Gammaproteobacteria bacterium]|nr:TIGR02281 family clan AA aspartic protease [Gammaproteobacteria bacterium]|tara:strand:+ start:98 stop:607 length:510 start_codon:yes stop_codon:yes gene_type:complete
MNTKKTGTGMIFAACILGMFALTLFFGNMEKNQHNPNRDPQSHVLQNAVEVTLKKNRQGHYLAAGSINHQPVEFLLDTGATDVVVPAGLADDLQLRIGRRGTAMTANGSVTVFETNIDVLSIGEINLYNVRASINPSMTAPGVLLGMSALGRIEFAHEGDTLTLRQKSQ